MEPILGPWLVSLLSLFPWCDLSPDPHLDPSPGPLPTRALLLPRLFWGRNVDSWLPKSKDLQSRNGHQRPAQP